MKIMRRHGGFAHSQNFHTRDFYRNYIVDMLQTTFDEEKFAANNGEAILREQVRRDDGVGNAGFIFEAQEDKPFRSAGTLACDNGTGDADISPIANVGEIDGANDIEGVQYRPIVRQRVRA